MKFIIIINYISYIIWYFPVFKQRNTKYFPFFFVMAFVAPLLLDISYFLKTVTNDFYPTGYLLTLAVLLEKKKAYFLIVVAIIAAVVFPIVKLHSSWMFGIATALCLVIFLKVLQDSVEDFIKTHEINLFLVLLFVYFSIDLVKLFDIALSLNLGIVYYFFGVFSQLFLGIAFWFININTKSFKVRIKTLEDM